MPAVFADSDNPDRLVPIVTDPSKFVIAVAGDPDRTNAYAMSNDGPHGDYTAKRIDRSPSTDLVCEPGARGWNQPSDFAPSASGWIDCG